MSLQLQWGDWHSSTHKFISTYRCLLFGRKAMTNLHSILKSRDITLPVTICIVKAMVSPVVMYRCESWTIKRAERQQVDAFNYHVGDSQDSWESLGQQGDQTNPKWNQLWIFIGRTDAEAEAPILWSSDAKSWLTGENPDAGEDWRQEEKGMTEDEMVGWHHQLDANEFG